MSDVASRQGEVRYRLKTPYRDGTTHIILEPLDFIARLAALVPKPRVNLTRFHGVFAPNSTLRAQITPGRRGRDARGSTGETPNQRRAAMTWAQRAKRVFRIAIETCPHCGGTLKIIASIDDPALIKHFLEHLAQRDACPPRHRTPAPRASPDRHTTDAAPIPSRTRSGAVTPTGSGISGGEETAAMLAAAWY